MPSTPPLRILVVLLFVGGATSLAEGQSLEWLPFEDALARADTTGKPVLVDVYTPWCGWCHKMKTEVYPSRNVQSCLAHRFVLTRLNRDDSKTTHMYAGRRFTTRRLATVLGVDAVPGIAVLAPNGEPVLHRTGYVKPPRLRQFLIAGARAANDRSHSQATPPCLDRAN